LFGAGGDEVLMKLPVHAAEEGLVKEDLLLAVNNFQRPIRALLPRSRSMMSASDLSRYFILSFHMESYKPEVMEAVEYFVENIARRHDSLTILSPLRAYRLKMEDGKDRVLDFIEEVLKTDCAEYKVTRGMLVQKIEKATSRVNRLREPAGWMLSPYTLMFEFYNHCKLALVRFKDHFLSHHLKQAKVIRDLPPRGEGETWWIHFQQRSFEPVPVSFRNIVKKIALGQKTGQVRWPVAGGGRNWDFNTFEKQLTIIDKFPAVELSQTILAENVCYNVINWGALGDSFTNRGDFPRPEVEIKLEAVSRSSGGRSITTLDPVQGLRELQQHRDDYYELVFPFNGRIEGKRFRLILAGVKPGNRLSYAPGFESDKIRTMIEFYRRGKVEIRDLSMAGNRVSFGVAAYHRPGNKDEEQVGLIKVRAQLYDESGNASPVFNSHKVLRAAGDSVQISLPLPKKYRGRYIFQLSVCDLMANQLAAVKQRIKL
jgi:hypothetical protein